MLIMMKEVKTEKQNKKQYDWLKPYQFKKGQSGNPKGKPPGKSLKRWVREYFEQLPDKEKMNFLNRIDPELAWRMAEGNPQNDITSGGKPLESNQKVPTKEERKAGKAYEEKLKELQNERSNKS